MALLLIFLFSALAISFLCSILESVLMSTPFSYISMLEDKGYKPAKLFKVYKSDIDKPIAAILSLNTIANTIGAAGVGRQATLVFGSEWFGLISALTTIMILIFSEIIPKTIGTSYWKNLIGFAAGAIRVLIVLMFPLVKLIQLVSRWFTPGEEESIVSREEVTAMANIGEEEGVIQEKENKVIQNIMKLNNISVYDAMTPRIVASIAQENMSLKNFYRNETYRHYSRIPVYADSPEYITGYILMIDALEGLAEDKFDMRLKDIKRSISYFKGESTISDAWEELLKNKEQIGVVIDEYGCFEGILTLEDIIETILGLEIIDENDEVTDMQQYARERWERRQKKYDRLVFPKEEAVDKP